MFFLRSVDHDEDFSDPDPAPADYIVLKPCVPDELLMHFRGVFDLIEIVSLFRLPEEICRTVIIVIQKCRLADDRRSRLQVLLCFLRHFLFVRNPCSLPVYRHFLKGTEHPHSPVAEIVSGVAEGCVQSECALIGGETAEHPGLMPEDEYDLAGFAVGVVDKDKILQPDTQKAGDVMIGIRSSGVHSNGFSLVRKVFDINEKTIAVHYDELGMTLGESLLTPTRIYVKAIMNLLQNVNVKSISHITGGGFYENIPRSLPKGLSARIQRKDVQVLPIFDLIAKAGNVPERDMFNTYNMGVGMTVVVDAADVDAAIASLKASGEDAYVLGELVASDEGVIIE